jgi:multidrug efflux pump subunit AcrB
MTVPVTIIPMAVMPIVVPVMSVSMSVAVSMSMSVSMTVTMAAMTMTPVTVSGECRWREHHCTGKGSREANFAKHWFPPKELQELLALRFQ